MKRVVLAAVLALAATPAFAAPDGAKLYVDKGCIQCHGVDAADPLQGGFPKLAGLNADYLFAQMKDVKNAVRVNGLGPPLMRPIMGPMADEDLRAIADYLAKMKPFTKPEAVGQDKPGKQIFAKNCASCHGKEGAAPTGPAYPIIGGQDRDYLVAQMRDIRSKARTNGQTAVMTALRSLSDKDIDAVAEYLATVK
jgi:cytochrome c553